MQKSIFEFDSYKLFIRSWLESQPNKGHGLRSQISKVINTQTAFITQVLTGEAHFSADQLFGISDFVGLTKSEREFLLLLLQYERAGGAQYKSYLHEQLEEKRQTNRKLSRRLKSGTAPVAMDQSRYYSTWLYACLHVMTTVEKYRRSREEMARALKLPQAVINEAVDFLLQTQLLREAGGELLPGNTRIHLGTESPYLRQHHLNWNIFTVAKIFEDVKTDLHYSSVISLSHTDRDRVREIFTRAIEESKALVRDSAGEKVCAITLNLISVA